MSNLIDKIGMLIKKEKGSPDGKSKDDSKKSSSEILSELFEVFNAAPPKIDEESFKKSKKSKKKHKKEKKKRSRSTSSSDSDDSDGSRKRKKKKKKSKKHKKSSRTSSPYRSKTPPKINLNLDLLTSTHIRKDAIKVEKDTIKSEKTHVSIKSEKNDVTVKSEKDKENYEEKEKSKAQISSKDDKSRIVTAKTEDNTNFNITFNTIIDASQIPMPSSPKEKLDSNDLRLKIDNKSKIQIKNLKFSAVFEETVKKAEEEARKRKEKYEDGEVSDSSSSVEQLESSQFPKSSDPSGILKKKAAEEKAAEYEKSKKSKRSDSSHKSSHRDKDRSHRSRSKHRSRSGSRSRSRHHKSRSRSHGRRYSSRHRSRSRSPYHSGSYKSSYNYRGRPDPRRAWRSSRSPTGVRLADSEKKRLLEVARKNAINMLKNGAVPAGAAALPPHTRSQVMAAIQSGGKSVDELTDFCKHLSKKEALGELSSPSSNDEISDNEDTRAFHHPFLVKEKAPIVMNIRGGAPLPVKSNALAVVNKDELRIQFPVSSGSQHRETATEWIPVSPKKDSALPVAKLNSKPKTVPEKPAAAPPMILPPGPQPVPPPVIPGIPSAPLALPAPGPQAYPPGIEKKGPSKEILSMVCQKLSLIRKEQEQNELNTVSGLGFSGKRDSHLGQFTGSTGAQILTPRELASGSQAWAKKDQLTRAAPVRGGMGMALLQKMGWTPGQGLGKEGTGTLQPLMLEVKLDTKGLVAREEIGGRVNRTKARNIPAAIRRGGVPGNPNGPIVADGKHPVSLLGEYCSKKKLGPPEYELCFECGPDHKKNFLFKVKVGGVAYQPATASANKKQAKRDSATVALQKLGVLT